MKTLIEKILLIALVIGVGTGAKAQVKEPRFAANKPGEIKFSAGEVLTNNTGNKAFVSSYVLGVKSPFYLTASIKKPLINYLRPLAPGITAEEMLEKGCLQFSFFVDNRLVYKSDLHPASLSKNSKETDSVIGVPLKVIPRINHWGNYLWDRFKNNGGDSALTDGKHKFKVEIRPYIMNPDLKVAALIAEGELLLDVKMHEKVDPASVKISEVKPYTDLEVSGERFDKTKIQVLKAKELEDEFKNLSSLVVLKNGKILIEEYFNGADRTTLHDVRSVGKTFASTVTGIAIDEKYLKSENQTLKEFYDFKKFANYSDYKANTPLKDLLTMSSVFEGDDNKQESAGREDLMYPTSDWVKFALDLPVDTTHLKGNWHYFTAGVVVLGDVLHQTVPGGLEKYADEKLFKPLSITNYKWQYTPKNVANTAGGIRMNSLDFAKYAQLYKNEGVWKGKQVLSKEWVKKSFTKHKTLPGRENEYYGFLFWNRTYKVNGKDYEAFYCAGNGGNHIYIFKDIPFVVVVTATAYNTPYGHSQVQKLMEEYVLKAVLEK